MQKGHVLQFHCKECKSAINFSIFELEQNSTITCPFCSQKYSFTEPVLIRQLKKFVALCRQILESEEILANTSIGIDVGQHHVKIPYKLLLTRLNSSLELKVGNHLLNIEFRIEPLTDFKESLLK